ncbi:MAG TPA: EFR1 family ferrodoxin [Clostridia bacterium]|nr:EFR1 family ferrodoxin [Clostridia bacterium]
MKTNLFYFSATGNCLAVAKDIAAGLPGAQLFSIPQVINEQLDLEADNIGVVFPVYYCGIPRIISDFIKKLDPGKIRYMFAICTCGALPAGTLLEVQKQLEAKGITLNAGFSIPMPGNYIVKYGAFPVKKQESMFLKEKEKVRSIIQEIKEQKQSGIEKNNFIINRIGESVYKSKLSQFPTLDRNFTVNEKCNGCNTCERICPVGNIKMKDQKPEWQGNCEHCLACIQWCPREAIQYSAQTINRKRYHNPEVTIKEIIRGKI